MHFGKPAIVAMALATSLLLGACADGDPQDTASDGADDQATDGTGDDGTDGDGASGDGASGDGDGGTGDADALPDPNDQVQDGEYRGRGIVLPVPDGYELDPGLYMQGFVAAVADDGSRQIVGQAVDTDEVPEAPSLQDVIDANNEQFGEPALEEDVEVDGASQATRLRYDGAVPSQTPDGDDLTLLLVVAENDEGELGIFNYVAPEDDYDEEQARTVLASAGFDPDSAPQQPATPAPAP